MLNELQKIKEKIQGSKKYLHHTYGVQGIGIFGSFVHNEDTLLSDIDILFDVDEKKQDLSLFDLVDIKNYLENLLKKTVDIVDKKSIKPFLKEKILKEVVMI